MINWTLSVEDVACSVDDMKATVDCSSSFVQRDDRVSGEEGLRVPIDAISGLDDVDTRLWRPPRGLALV